MAMRILKPLVRWGGYYPSKKYTPLVYPGGYTTMDAAIGPLDPLNTFSGDIVRFTTKRGLPMKSLKVSLSPQQDLHGYDSPWPEGGGVNKLPPAASYSAVTVNGVTVTPYPDGHYHLEKGAATENNATIRINLAKSVPVSAGMYFAPICATKNANVVIDINDSAYNRTATGFCGKASTEITDAGTGVAEIITLFVVASQSNLSLDIYPLISETALDVFSPYANECPISGWTGCDVTRTGKNLIGISIQDTTLGTVSVTQNQDGSITLNGTASYGFNIADASTVDARYVPQKLYAGKTYTLSGSLNKPTSEAYLQLVYIDDVTGSLISIVCSSAIPNTFTPSHDATLNNMYFTIRQGCVCSNDTIKPQLELSSTATEYEKYQGASSPVTWQDNAGIVYGGTIDIISGVLTVNRKTITLDGSQSFSASSNNRFYFNISEAKTIDSTNQTTDVSVICDKAKSLTWAALSYNDVVGTSFCCAPVYGNGIAFRWDNITTASDWVTYFSNNPTVFSYELKNPITYQLTPNQITALKGYNAVWSDAGPVEVTAYGTPIVEPNVPTRQALNLLLGGAYRNDQTEDDVSDEEALDILLGGADR